MLKNSREVSIIVAIDSTKTKELLDSKTIRVLEGANTYTLLRISIVNIDNLEYFTKNNTIKKEAIDKVLKLFKKLLVNNLSSALVYYTLISK